MVDCQEGSTISFQSPFREWLSQLRFCTVVPLLCVWTQIIEVASWTKPMLLHIGCVNARIVEDKPETLFQTHLSLKCPLPSP